MYSIGTAKYLIANSIVKMKVWTSLLTGLQNTFIEIRQTQLVLQMIGLTNSSDLSNSIGLTNATGLIVY